MGEAKAEAAPQAEVHPSCSHHCLHGMFPGGVQCKDVSGCQPVWGYLVMCDRADLGLGASSKQPRPDRLRCLELL